MGMPVTVRLRRLEALHLEDVVEDITRPIGDRKAGAGHTAP